MSELNSSPVNLIKKRGEVLTKVNSCREAFEKKEKRIKEDLEEARRIWKEVSKTFPWWQSLP